MSSRGLQNTPDLPDSPLLLTELEKRAWSLWFAGWTASMVARWKRENNARRFPVINGTPEPIFGSPRNAA